jgi:hypothetical protein
VYLLVEVLHAVPQVLDLIRLLPEHPHAWGVLFGPRHLLKQPAQSV